MNKGIGKYEPINEQETQDEPTEEISSDQQRKMMYLVFYKRNHEKLQWWQIIQAYLYYVFVSKSFRTKAFVHVELSIEAPNDMVCYGINQGEIIVHRSYNKTFTNEDYDPPTIRGFYPSIEDYNKIIDFLELQIKNKKGFDDSYRWDFVPIVNWFKTPNKNKWFCSKLISVALKQAKDTKYLLGIKNNPSYMTPHDLYVKMFPHTGNIPPIDIRTHSKDINFILQSQH